MDRERRQALIHLCKNFSDRERQYYLMYEAKQLSMGKITIIFVELTNGEVIETIISTDDLEKVKDFIDRWLGVWSEGTKSYYILGYGGVLNEERKNHR